MRARLGLRNALDGQHVGYGVDDGESSVVVSSERGDQQGVIAQQLRTVWVTVLGGALPTTSTYRML